jgi:hypothetical protein
MATTRQIKLVFSCKTHQHLRVASYSPPDSYVCATTLKAEPEQEKLEQKLNKPRVSA